jgi:hypothetical protein
VSSVLLWIQNLPVFVSIAESSSVWAFGALSLVSWFFVLYFGRMLPFLGAAY